MRRRRLPLGVILPIGLVLLVVALAALQYRWLGQVSQAERDQLRSTLAQRARAFADDFDREIGLIQSALQIDPAAAAAGDFAGFATRYDAWREGARFPHLVTGVYLARLGDRTGHLLAWTADRRTFEPAAWPEALGLVRSRLLPDTDRIRSSAPPDVAQVVALTPFPVMSDVPAIVTQVTVVSRDRVEAGPAESLRRVAPLAAGRGVSINELLFSVRGERAFVIVHLNDAVLRGELLPAIAQRHFPDDGAERYRVSVVDSSGTPVLWRHLGPGEIIDAARADVVTPFFGLRFEARTDNSRLMAWSVSNTVRPVGPVAPSTGATPSGTASSGATSPGATVFRAPGLSSQFQVFLESHESADAPAGIASTARAALSVAPASWQLRLQHAEGSLEAAVARARTRNLWLSFSILSVLIVGVGLVVLNARRSERLASQQMDFVATVSHELRTPLAVIRSAAQNLSAGVVHDADQARRYGDLIDTEGRRLTDMVEQVLEYAGLSGDRRALRTHPVDVGHLIDDVLASCRPLLDAQDFEVRVAVAEDLPPVLADPDAIRRALTNLVTNAIKHGADGRWLEVSSRAVAARGRRDVQVQVSDRGRGIDPADLPHVFEPFYRGQRALERQVQGNGLGLSLVRRIAEAHGGSVAVTSSPADGTTFTLTLPAANPDVSTAPLGDVAPDATGHAH